MFTPTFKNYQMVRVEHYGEQHPAFIKVHAERKKINKRLAYLKKEIQTERISTAEIIELQSLAEYIPEDDILLKEWAGMPEFKN